MTRGTTPIISLTLPIDLSSASTVWATFSQKIGGVRREVFTVEKDRMTFTDKSKNDVPKFIITFTLTQAETLSLSDEAKTVEIQVRYLIDGAAGATTRRELTVERILKEGEITND